MRAGVPAFYRWLSEKYPMILQDVIEEDPVETDAGIIPVDFSLPNPNGLECVIARYPRTVCKQPPLPERRNTAARRFVLFTSW